MAMGFFVFTISTLTPLDNIGVITMKMMSITSITSTMGVTLISATGGGTFCFIISIVLRFRPPDPRPAAETHSTRPIPGRMLLSHPLRSLQEVVDQLRAGVAHLDVEGLDPAGKQVEHPDRRDSHEQPDSGGHQGFGNTARHRAQTSGFLRRNPLERVDDSDHGAEQSDERRRRANGRQTRYAALQLRVDDRLGAFQGALGSFDFFP